MSPKPATRGRGSKPMFSDLNYAAATPEIFLAVASMVLLILGVFQGDKSTRLIGWLAAIALAVDAYLAVHVAPATGATPAFANQFIVDGFAGFMKVLTLLATAASILISLGYAERNG